MQILICIWTHDCFKVLENNSKVQLEFRISQRKIMRLFRKFMLVLLSFIFGRYRHNLKRYTGWVKGEQYILKGAENAPFFFKRL